MIQTGDKFKEKPEYISGRSQDDSASIPRAQGVIEWFDEYENNANYMLWPSQSQSLNPAEHL